MLNGPAENIAAQNLEAEGSVIGAVLAFPESIHEVLAVLRPEDCYRESHAKILRAMCEMTERGDPIDLLTVADLLKAKGELDAVGGAAYLAACHDATPTAANVVYYARLIKKASQSRELVALFRDATERIQSADDPVMVAAEVASQLLQVNPVRSNVSHIETLITECLKDLQKAYETKGRIVGIPTGLKEFESLHGGISREDLILIGARTSQGKTSLAGTIAKNTANLGYPVAFVSAESNPKKIAMRLISEAAQVENVRLQFGILAERDFGNIAAAAGRLAALPIWFVGGVRSWETIKAHLRAIKLREPNLSLVIIDYAQLLSAPVAEKKRYLELSKISSEAKGLAIELNAAVMLLSQLSRDLEKNPAKPGQSNTPRRPRLSDLRESGSLEQDADIVFFLHRESEDRNKPTELIIAKNRDGRIGSVKLRFNDKTVSFEDRATGFQMRCAQSVSTSRRKMGAETNTKPTWPLRKETN